MTAQLKEYLTEMMTDGKVIAGSVLATCWDEAEEKCRDCEYVVGELIEVILVGEN